jgi:hypothetical protein
MQLMEKNDLSVMKAENDRLMADVEKLKQRLREEITRTQAGVRLDLNLEKGLSGNFRSYINLGAERQTFKGRIRDETSAQELKVREVDTRIESEIAGLRTTIETAKVSHLQFEISNLGAEKTFHSKRHFNTSLQSVCTP